MKFKKFEEADTVFGKGQEEYNVLPGKFQMEQNGLATFCIELTDMDMEKARRNGNVIWLQVLTFNKSLQPLRISVDKPDFTDGNKSDKTQEQV